MNAPTFQGSQEQQALAEEIFQMMIMQSAFFSVDAPIKQTLSNLADFFAARHQQERDTMAQEIDAALRENSQIFQREERDDEIVYMTSRQGTYEPRHEDSGHMFKQRLYEPENPLPIDDISVVVSTSRPALTTVEPVFISDYWQEQAAVALADRAASGSVAHGEDSEYPPVPGLMEDQPIDTLTEESIINEVIPDDYIPHERVPQPPALEEAILPETIHSDEVLSEVLSTDHDVNGAPDVLAVDEETPAPVAPTIEDVADVDEEEAVELAETEPDETIDAETITEAEEEPVEERIELTAADVVEMPPEQPEHPAIPLTDMILTLPDGTPIDLSKPNAELLESHINGLEAALIDSLDRDPLRRIVRFGRSLFPESSLVNLGKNDMRRIRDYIMEVREPLPDTAIIADLYHYNPRQSAYESFRFSLNYRLSREKDFEFVGVEGARLWSTKGLKSIGTRRIKAGEMAQLTSYLVEGYDDSLVTEDPEIIRETGEVTHRLTFFEWAYGILPFNANLATLLPASMLPDQRSAVLRIESPQHYTGYLVEVRYPTGNRGGWLQGLEEFFHEHLVAGSLITLASTEEPNIFTIAYQEIPPTEDRILTLDEKKNKFTFANMSYYSMVDADHLIVQSKFGKLKNLKSIPINERRKADMLLKHVFKVAGDQIGTRSEPMHQILLDDLHVAYNVLRPASRSYLRSLLEADESYAVDESLPDLYSYIPEPEPEGDEEDDEEDEDPILARWGAYDDDDYQGR